MVRGLLSGRSRDKVLRASTSTTKGRRLCASSLGASTKQRHPHHHVISVINVCLNGNEQTTTTTRSTVTSSTLTTRATTTTAATTTAATSSSSNTQYHSLDKPFPLWWTVTQVGGPTRAALSPELSRPRTVRKVCLFTQAAGHSTASPFVRW